MDAPLTARIEQVDTAMVLPVRMRVLRAGTPSSDPAFEGDDDPATVHLAAFIDDRVLAVSTWLWRPWPFQTDRLAAQLRGMATDDAAQGTGLGGLLLEAGVARAFAAGAQIAWANARDSALRFYRSHGFDVEGEGFRTAETHLPHHRIIRRCDVAPADVRGLAALL